MNLITLCFGPNGLSKLFYDHLLTTRFFNLETERDFLGAIWCLHQKVNFGTCNKLSIEFNDTKNVALLEGLCYTILPEWKLKSNGL